MIKRWIPLGSATLLLVACVNLTPAGARVRLLPESERASVAHCQPLGQVSVSSPDALRNAAADQSGDTALYAVRDMGGSFYLRGQVYRCGPAEPGPAPAVNAAVTAGPAPGPAEAQRSEKCRQKGGEWRDSRCLVEIEIE